MSGPEPITIELEVLEWLNAAIPGLSRHASGMYNKRNEPYRKPADPIGAGCLGCVGEYVVSLWLDKKWITYRRKPHTIHSDVGERFEVRSTDVPGGSLIIHPRDPDDKPFILVHHQDLICKIVGWQYAKECKQEKFWRDEKPKYKNPAFFVPPSHLLPMSSLPR